MDKPRLSPRCVIASVLGLGLVTGCAAPEGTNFGTATESVTPTLPTTSSSTTPASTDESPTASPSRTSESTPTTPTPTVIGTVRKTPTRTATETKTPDSAAQNAAFEAFDGTLDPSRSTDETVTGLTETVTLAMTDSGDLSGKGSCNQYTATATGKPTALKISNIASTRKACADSVMDEENTYFDMLRNIESVVLSEDYVTFTTAQAKKVVFHRAKK